jgi:hypothetical protein
MICLTVLLISCSLENTRQSVGISTKPLLSGEKLENSTKLNWKITWGKIRTSKEDEED